MSETGAILQRYIANVIDIFQLDFGLVETGAEFESASIDFS